MFINIRYYKNTFTFFPETFQLCNADKAIIVMCCLNQKPPKNKKVYCLLNVRLKPESQQKLKKTDKDSPLCCLVAEMRLSECKAGFAVHFEDLFN